ncbi:hypothetical protein SELMODRAFT_411952 [Selaginella moellendorffii]|uniref:Uncharacterized protein n=1 Tax=Selaginella moellendorffii TaxID=88036 RepID=D8RJJ8_SELML|nr:hypothetical protein SELMODRAFT_411952 [Selaginella moellendorffii]
MSNDFLCGIRCFESRSQTTKRNRRRHSRFFYTKLKVSFNLMLHAPRAYPWQPDKVMVSTFAAIRESEALCLAFADYAYRRYVSPGTKELGDAVATLEGLEDVRLDATLSELYAAATAAASGRIAVFVETFSNPLVTVADVPVISKLCKKSGYALVRPSESECNDSGTSILSQQFCCLFEFTRHKAARLLRSKFQTDLMEPAVDNNAVSGVTTSLPLGKLLAVLPQITSGMLWELQKGSLAA